MLLGFAGELEAAGPVNPADLPPAGMVPARLRLARCGGFRRGRRNLAAFETPAGDAKGDTICRNTRKPCPCCGEMRAKNRPVETSWQVEFIPGHFSERLENDVPFQIRLQKVR